MMLALYLSKFWSIKIISDAKMTAKGIVRMLGTFQINIS